MLNSLFHLVNIVLMSALLLVVATFTGGCSTSKASSAKNTPTESLRGLHSLSGPSTKKSRSKRRNQEEMSEIRRTALQETALTIGAQAALAWRAERINRDLRENSRHLDRIFDFNSLILEDNVLPPVLLEGRQTLNLDSPHAIRLADRTYRIDKQARFVTTPPNWREYIELNFQKPEVPNETLLPKNDQEKEVWDYYVNEGWQNGIHQANVIFAENLARLKQDYVGMVLYKKLLAQNIVTPPYVATTDLGVTGDSTQINIDDRVLRIAALPGLQTDANLWQPIVTETANEVRALSRQLDKVTSSIQDSLSSGEWQAVIDSIH